MSFEKISKTFINITWKSLFFHLVILSLNLENCIFSFSVSHLIKLSSSSWCPNILFKSLWNIGNFLSLNVLCIFESCIEIKIKLKFYFHASLWCLKRFYEGLKGTQRSVKIKIYLNFFSSSGIGTRRVILVQVFKIVNCWLAHTFLKAIRTSCIGQNFILKLCVSFYNVT